MESQAPFMRRTPSPTIRREMSLTSNHIQKDNHLTFFYEDNNSKFVIDIKRIHG